jgi:hypothetical protein
MLSLVRAHVLRANTNEYYAEVVDALRKIGDNSAIRAKEKTVATEAGSTCKRFMRTAGDTILNTSNISPAMPPRDKCGNALSRGNPHAFKTLLRLPMDQSEVDAVLVVEGLIPFDQMSNDAFVGTTHGSCFLAACCLTKQC